MALPAYVETPIASLDETYDRLQATFLSHKTLPIEYRLYHLKQLAFLLTDNEDRIKASIKADLGKGAFDAAVGDIWPTLNEIELAVKRLPEWMQDEKATRDSTLMFKLARPRVVRQPKGVALIIGAWNYPWMLSLGPLIGAISAGCPAIIKMSEHSPASAALMAELIPRYLDEDAYTIVNGGPEQSTVLLAKRWGHILFTGAGSIGKIVATAAAKTLTSSTLELGGKSPVIVASDADLTITAKRMLSIKPLGSGQMCVCPDYVLCVKERVDDLVAECIKTLDAFFPKNSDRSILVDGPQSCSLRNSRDFDRLANAVDEADMKGKLMYRGEQDPKTRRMGVNVVRLNRNGEGEDGLVVKEEIFGPILPIIPVDDVDTAIRYVNARPTPLALYVCSASRSVFDKVIHETVSGSAIWNDFGMAPIARTLPFGGVGESGWGSYHGEDGFLAFSHRKAVLEVPYWMELAQKARYPPHAKGNTERMMRLVMTAGIPFQRPVSVEHERKLIERRKTRKHLAIGVLIVLIGALIGVAARTGAVPGLAAFVSSVRAAVGV